MRQLVEAYGKQKGYVVKYNRGYIVSILFNEEGWYLYIFPVKIAIHLVYVYIVHYIVFQTFFL